MSLFFPGQDNGNEAKGKIIEEKISQISALSSRALLHQVVQSES